jgi:hypothetical protein
LKNITSIEVGYAVDKMGFICSRFVKKTFFYLNMKIIIPARLITLITQTQIAVAPVITPPPSIHAFNLKKKCEEYLVKL